MKSELVAPVVKTLFIPEGNPGVREVREIRVLPRIRDAAGDSGELTVTGEMDIELVYLAKADKKSEPRKKQNKEENRDISAEAARAEILNRLEKSLLNEDSEPTEKEWRLSLEIPFTMTFDIEPLMHRNIMEFEPVVQNVNWVLISPKALEFEAVLKPHDLTRVEPEEGPADQPETDLRDSEEERTGAEERGQAEVREESQKEVQERGTAVFDIDPGVSLTEIPVDTEIIPEAMAEKTDFSPDTMRNDPEIPADALTKEAAGEPEPLIREAAGEPDILIKEAAGISDTMIIETAGNADMAIRETAGISDIMTESESTADTFSSQELFKIPEREIPQSRMPEIKHIFHETGPVIFPRSGYYQMKFYRVQYGEDLDAVAEKLGVAREIIKALNKVTEEEIKTGLLLSIPNN